MRTGRVSVGSLAGDAARLQAGFHLSEDQQAVASLRRLRDRCEPLRLCTWRRGVFKGNIFARIYTSGSAQGFPYAPPGDLLKVTPQPTSFLSPIVGTDRIDELRLVPGMILVTRSGMNLGKAIWCRPDMAALVGSDDLIRIEVNPEHTHPGYVYAFLASRYGHAWIRKQIYGGNIKHIEPEHLSVMPVPRLGADLEAEVALLVESHGRKVAAYNEAIERATKQVLSSASLMDIGTDGWSSDQRRRGWTVHRLGTETIRALNHDPLAVSAMARISSSAHSLLGDLCDPALFKGKIIFRRIDAEPPYSVMLLGQRNAFRFRPYGRHISRSSIKGLGLQVPTGTTLIPSHGTLGEGELYCRAIIVTDRMADTYAFSGDFFRCVPLQDRVPPGYLYAFMRSELAFRLLRSISAGGKQQEQHPRLMYRLPVPRLNDGEEAAINRIVLDACRTLDEAMQEEEQARALVERAIEEAT